MTTITGSSALSGLWRRRGTRPGRGLRLVRVGRHSDAGQRGFKCRDIPMQQSMGQMEGKVNILAWPGYAENGSNDPKVDWVTPFEKATGCQANVKYFGTSDEAVNLMKTGGYDVVSASGDASLRLIAGR